MRWIDAYWMETRQTRETKPPELRETIIQSNAAEECRLRKLYVPMTAEEYDPETNSLYAVSAPECGGDVTDRLMLLDGTRYLERSYEENNIVGAVKTFYIIKTQGMAVTDMVRSMTVKGTPVYNTLSILKPDWYDPAIDKLELYTTASDTPDTLPQESWEACEDISSVNVITYEDVQYISITLTRSYDNLWYGIWLYHSKGGTDLRNAVITESVKTTMVQSDVQFFQMPAIADYDSSSDLLWIFAGGNKRFDFSIVPASYEDGGEADFLVFDRGISGTVEFRLYQSTADPPVDVRQYTAAQVEEGLRDYEIVTEEVPHFVCAGYVQTGDAAVRQQLTMQQHTMADGRICVYPAPKSVTRMTLELECTQLQAQYLEEALCHVPLLLTGVKAGAVNAQNQNYPQGIGRQYILDGSAEIGEKFSGSGIYSVKLPVIVDMGDEGERFCDLFGIQLYYDEAEVPEGFSSFHFSLREPIHDLLGRVRPSGLFVRNSVYFTSSETFLFRYRKQSGYIPYDPYNFLYHGDTLVKANLAPDTVQEFLLSPGANVFTFYFYDGTDFKTRSEDYRLTVFRQVKL